MRPQALGVARASVAAAMIVVCGVPLAYAGLRLMEHGVIPDFDGRQFALLRRSAAVSVGAAVTAGLLGGLLGLAIESLRGPGRYILAVLTVIPFLVPPWVFAVSWIDLGGADGLLARGARGLLGTEPAGSGLYSPAGAAWVLGSAYITIPAAAVVLTLRTRDPSLEAAARLARGPLAAFWHFTVRPAAPMALTGALIVFLLALTNFSVPSLFQVTVYAVEIHTLFAAFHDVSGALRATAPLMLVAAAAIGLWRALIGLQPRPVLGTGRRSAYLPLPTRWRWGLGGTGAAVAGTCAVLPLLTLAWRTGSLAALHDAWTAGREELITSLVVAGVTAVILVFLSWMAVESFQASRLIVPLALLALLSFGMTGPALGTALIAAWNHADWRGTVYDSLAIVVLACAARYLIAALLVLWVARATLPAAPIHAAQVAGAPWGRRLALIHAPLLMPGLALAAGIGFVLALHDVDAGVLLTPPGYTTLSVRVFGLMHYGPNALVTGLSLVIVGVALGAGVLVTAAAVAWRRWVHA